MLGDCRQVDSNRLMLYMWLVLYIKDLQYVYTGKLIKTVGSGWEDEIPSILKSDMGNLTEASQGSGLSMSQRIIKSGLDSITGPDAENIVTLFEGREYSSFRYVSTEICFACMC